jgi:hypothetical protein
MLGMLAQGNLPSQRPVRQILNNHFCSTNPQNSPHVQQSLKAAAEISMVVEVSNSTAVLVIQ